ncbi:quinol-cytochrome oxidoreductase complex cytochrome b subunit [Bacilli bacterium PM5-3]|nr:quinol-cytochrome oxidoreductase complex cytochrome b subunit [Bacilli bacterium PM5-3]MDH6603559.1 quinol-cytochrome oxidoreductase complex cytochrome b subunit [Bacilli bacterium PM5-9]
MNLNDTKTVIKIGKIINILLIVLTILLFLTFQILSPGINAKDSNSLHLSVLISTAIFVFAVVLLVLSIILKKKNPKIQGLGLMIVSGVMLASFAFTGIMIGIVLFITSGLSISNLSKNKIDDTIVEEINC